MTDRTHTAGPFIIRGEDLDNPANAMGVEPTTGDGGGWPYFIRQDREFAMGETPLWLAHGIQRIEDARLFGAADQLLAALKAVLPYAESRIEDMEECAEASRDCPRTGAEAEAAMRKCRDAFQAAQAVIAKVEGRHA